jgi:apolipoprotein N-acyltransferase
MLRHLLIALVTGSTMPLAFAPFSFWPIAILAPVILVFQSGLLDSTRQVFWLGWCFGVGYFSFGVYWLYNSMHVYGHAPPFVAGGLTALMIVTLALFVAAALAGYHRLQRDWSGAWAIWSLPLLWFAMEWAKGWVLTGFPWLSIGYAHIDSPLNGFAPLIGVYGLSALSLVISLALVRMVQTRKVLYAVPVVVIGLAGYLLFQIEWSEADGEPLKITMVQGNVPQELKWNRSERPKIIQRYWKASQKHWDSDLVVWPEVAIPGRSEDMEQGYLIPMATELAAAESNLLTGIVVSRWLRREYHNSMLLLGEHQGVYHKRHMVPFGEYMPFRSVLEFMRAYIKIPMSDMTPGPREQPPMIVNDVRLGVSICYEDVFSRDINLDLPEAHILVNTSNDAWFGDSLAPHQHLEIAQMRSLETSRPMVRSTNTGSSAFIDHKGRVTDRTAQFEFATLTTELQGRQGATPLLTFARLQPYLAMLILLALAALLWIGYRQSHKLA